MAALNYNYKPHVVCIPFPAQSHIKAMINLAKLLHSRGFYITLVLTEFDFARLVASSSSASLQNLQDLSFQTIPDGLPPDNARGLLDFPELCHVLPGEPKKAFRDLLMRLLASSSDIIPPITNIISDGFLSFARTVGEQLGIPVLLFFTVGACGLLGFLQLDELVKRGLFPLKDEGCLTNGYLETPIEWVPGLIKGAKMKHLPTFLRTTDPNDPSFHTTAEAAMNALNAKGIIFNTFDDLEAKVLEAIKTKISNLYTIGPLSLLCKEGNRQDLLPLVSNLWKEDTNCLQWLDKRNPKSVIYVNYGSLTILTAEQLVEFAWGLANSKHPFLWVIRPDLVKEEMGNIITHEYMEDIQGRGLLAGWCPQEKVLQHPSVALFFTHCGWNSTLESISEGVPMICSPFFAEQQMNSLYASQEWRVGMEMEEGEIRREKVEWLVREMIEGEKGQEVRKNAIEWKRKAEEAINPGGLSHNNFDKLVKNLMFKET